MTPVSGSKRNPKQSRQVEEVEEVEEEAVRAVTEVEAGGIQGRSLADSSRYEISTDILHGRRIGTRN